MNNIIFKSLIKRNGSRLTYNICHLNYDIMKIHNELIETILEKVNDKICSNILMIKTYKRIKINHFIKSNINIRKKRMER